MSLKSKRFLALGVVLLGICVICVVVFFNNKESTRLDDGTSVAFDNKPLESSTTASSDPFDVGELRKQGVPVLIDFTATWCIPCRTFNPILKEVKEELGDKVVIELVDVDKYRKFTTYYPVRAIPTQLLFNSDGTPYVPSHGNEKGLYGFTAYAAGEQSVTIHEGTFSKENLLKLLETMGLER